MISTFKNKLSREHCLGRSLYIGGKNEKVNYKRDSLLLSLLCLEYKSRT